MDFKKVDNWKSLHELKKLKDLSSPPKELFYIGRWNPDIFINCVAIVGSRRMTSYGENVIEKIIPQLVFEKKTIVSGFMTGVDQYAHQTAIENDGKTIAVLGWGINYKLQDYDLKLSRQIIDSGGLLLSEWENKKPSLWTFPVRNRIVAALSEEVIIIEAAAQSGSLITARIAKQLNRKLWAVPGPITSKTSVGTNALIAANEAKMWTGIVGANHDSPATSHSDPLLNLLSNDSLTTNEIARKLNLPVSEIGAKLSLLTLEGILLEKDGKYCLNA